MDVAEAYQHIRNALTIDIGRFYASGSGLGLGKGQIYENIRFPLYCQENNEFRTAEGLIYVLTHECDLDVGNARFMNSDVLICPIIKLDDVVTEYSAEVASSEQLVSFLTNLAARNVYRAFYFPPGLTQIPYGGVIYLNQITNTSVLAFRLPTARPIGALTAFGLNYVEQVLENHLLRPKVDRLAFGLI